MEATKIISIHALLAESDRIFTNGKQLVHISIHALLAESDPKSFRGRRCSANFYPRSPCGERLEDSTKSTVS